MEATAMVLTVPVRNSCCPINAAQLAVNRHRTLMNLFDKQPALGTGVFVAPNAAIIGDVKLGNHASVFYGCVLRGEPLNFG